MSQIKELFKVIFSSGGLSLMRILTAVVVLDIMTVWTIDCIKNMEIQDMPSGVVGIFVAMVGSKALQVFAEQPAKTP